MDLLAEIKHKATQVPEVDRPGIAAIVRHLEQAERCLEFGRAGEDNFFTDVVYRTNHAYEGALKEAFEKLTGKDASQETPHDIENHLEKNSVLRSRVLDMMRNYRQAWRNPSTHEYELFFTGQEALLAIITVSAFVAVLLDQIVDQLAVQRQAAASEPSVAKLTDSIANYSRLSLPDQVVELIRFFVTSSSPTFPSPVTSSESYLETAIANFLRKVEPSLAVRLEPSLSIGGRVLRPDILVNRGDETVVIEIKRAMHNGLGRDAAVLQVLSYAKALNATRAIVVFMPEAPGEVKVETKKFTTTGVPTTVTEIYPADLTFRYSRQPSASAEFKR